MPNPSFIPKITWNAAASTFTFSRVPEADPFAEQLKANWNVHVANSGSKSTQANYVEEIWTITFSFLTSAEKATLKTFFTTWAGLGKAFVYYPSNELGTNYTLTLDDPTWSFDRMLPDGAGDFLYRLKIRVRQVIA